MFDRNWTYWMKKEMAWTRVETALIQIHDLLEIVLDKAREMLAPLYEDLWRPQSGTNLMRVRTEFDPLPSIHNAASSMFQSERKACSQKIRIRWEATEEQDPDDWD